MTIEDQLAEARERIAQLEAILGQRSKDIRAWCRIGLTPTEARMLGVILAVGSIKKSDLYDAIYSGPEFAQRDPPDPKVIDVRLCYIRQKLKPLGIEIKTVWGVCLEIDRDNASRAKQLVLGASQVLEAA